MSSILSIEIIWMQEETIRAEHALAYVKKSYTLTELI
jgi:hypothetical protein